MRGSDRARDRASARDIDKDTHRAGHSDRERRRQITQIQTVHTYLHLAHN